METICFRMPQSLHIPIAKCVIRQIERQLSVSKAGQTCAGFSGKIDGETGASGSAHTTTLPGTASPTSLDNSIRGQVHVVNFST